VGKYLNRRKDLKRGKAFDAMDKHREDEGGSL